MSKLRAFTMPKWGIEMTEGVIANWEIAEGASFAKGDLLTLIETDKITNEVEAEYDAFVCRLIAQPGETYPVGALLAVFGDGAADAGVVDSFVASFGGAAAPPVVGNDAPAPAVAAPAVQVPIDNKVISPGAVNLARRDGIDVSGINGSGRNGRITFQDVDQAGKAPVALPYGAPVSITPVAGLDQYFASPLAKRVASSHGVDLGKVAGSGPRGRISKADVLQHVVPTTPEPVAAAPVAATTPSPIPADGVRVVRMSPMRKAIARQLTLSKSTIPHFYLRNSAAIDALLAMREQAKRATGAAPSINDYLVRACALALVRHPDINVQVHGDEIHQFGHADIAVAVATDKGLLTPIIRAADTKSVAAISAEVKSLAERARAGKLAPEEFQGGSFSISNLGMFGIDTFDAIINPPQGAILAVGAGRQSAGAANHALQFSTRIQLSLSCDHRAIDGAVGAKFLAELTALIEMPEELTR
ncbi:2-oxo acid dehydrogenase subunit E2 [Sphingobium sp.]|uniref:2-oxo acid dehydrogenase subunit E2 n=1 Tax=Sphingobium sp. TaxID=1912891 RepID=UPI002B6CD341|nr:2-oxo acid dehydrogenase subunit E2 [Sphingobium sp.]HUD92798.1 2-oxo acid dehydrogenase subunit E2 [Sphingobium sp.]